MRRALRVLAVLLVSGTGLIGVTSAQGASSSQLLRWDLVEFSPAPTTILAAGTAVSKDPATGDALAVTGTGQADLGAATARGSGTYVYRHAGAVVGRGFYVITQFVSWTPLSGGLAGVPVRDGIGDRGDARSGILDMRFAAFQDGKRVAVGVLSVHCALPGAPPTAVEGIRVRIDNGGQFTRIVDNGPTLFHQLARF